MPMTLKSIRAARARLAKIPKRPKDKPLDELIQWVIDNDDRYKGKTVREIFLLSCGGAEEQADLLELEVDACGDSDTVRGFCLGCIERSHKSLVDEAKCRDPQPE